VPRIRQKNRVRGTLLKNWKINIKFRMWRALFNVPRSLKMLSKNIYFVFS
jgi:hypothetical protein